LLLAAASAREFFVISDLHLDLFYDATAPQANKCHASGSSTEPKILGRQGCDSPELLIRSTLKQMQDVKSDPEFIILTGDIVGHYTYDTPTDEGRVDKAYDKRLVQQTYEVVVNLFKEYFPGTQVIIAYGNNDGYGDYWNPNVRVAWEFWGTLLEYYSELNHEISLSFIEGGYYLTHTSTSLPVIVLNSNLFSIKDPIVSSSRRETQFKWLEDQLQSVSQPAVIVMHIPPGAGKYQGSRNWHPDDISRFTRIVERNASSISLILAGHLHSQTFQLIGSKPVIIHSAVSPLFGNNPMFRLYSSLDTTYDFSDFSLNLFDDKPTWELEYSMREYYGDSTSSFRSLYHYLSSTPEASLNYMKLALGVTRTDLPESVIFKMYLGAQANVEESLKTWMCTIEFVNQDEYDSCLL